MHFLQQLLELNPENNDVLTKPKLYVEISAIPENLGGGFHVVIPHLGRYFAQSDGETLVEALENLNSFVREVLMDPEYVETYEKEGNIKIPREKENDCG